MMVNEDLISTMDVLWSEPMQLVQLIIPIEAAHCSISYIDDLNLFQFKDGQAQKEFKEEGKR
ncbi:hypothetical protein Fmac_029123 [Flemingia macrophylla]|uniref:Uncharacterized protein n=1 Tax=Flemingia macrophylla TaxID=520843 RepID=A0ABD1L9F8_9FABA